MKLRLCPVFVLLSLFHALFGGSVFAQPDDLIQVGDLEAFLERPTPPLLFMLCFLYGPGEPGRYPSSQKHE